MQETFNPNWKAQKMTGNTTALHNVKLWKEWFALHMENRFVTFKHKGQLTMGRLIFHGEFLGFTEPGHVPNYQVTIKGPSGHRVEVDLHSAEVSIKENLDEAEKEVGYTWHSRAPKIPQDRIGNGQRANYQDKYYKEKARMEQAVHDWEKDPWPMEEKPS